MEGYEPGVLRGTKRLFLEHTVQHIFMEYSPGVAGKPGCVWLLCIGRGAAAGVHWWACRDAITGWG